MSHSVSAPRADQIFPNGIPVSPKHSGRVQDSIQERVNQEAIHIISEEPLNNPDIPLYSSQRKSAVLLTSQSKGAELDKAELVIKTTSILRPTDSKKKKVPFHRIEKVMCEKVLGLKPDEVESDEVESDEAELGGKEMTVIYKGKDKWHLPESLDNKHKVKKSDKNLTFYQRLLREYFTICDLEGRNVPHICPVEVAYTSSSKIALVFPRKFSDLLGALIDSHPKGLALPQIRSIFWQLLKFIQKMNQEGVAHLDLKPENILLEDSLNADEPEIFITDFEMAEPTSKKVTVKGTLGYVAPEMVLEGKCSHADVFSAALILFDLITLTPFYHFDKMHYPDSIYHHLAFLFMHFGVPPNFNLNSYKDSKLGKDFSFKKVFEELQNKYQGGFKEKILKWETNFPPEKYMIFYNFSVHHKSSWDGLIQELLKANTPLWKVEEELRQLIISDWKSEVGNSEKDKIHEYLEHLPSYSVKDFLRNSLWEKVEVNANEKVNTIEEIVNLFMQMADPDPDRRITPKEALQSLFFREDVELDFPEGIVGEGLLSLHIRPSDSDEETSYPLIPQENHTHHLVYGGGSFVVTLIDDDSQNTLLEQSISLPDHSTLQVMYDKEEKSYRMSCKKSEEAIH
ncbi:MAG: protein kinase [Chlamydiota bacterium]|jgi:serine/threonine protein kinase